MQTGPLVGAAATLLLLLLPSSLLGGPGLSAGCDLAASRRLVALCGRARKRSAGLPVQAPEALPVVREDPEKQMTLLERSLQDYLRQDNAVPDTDESKVLLESLNDSLSQLESELQFWSSLSSHRRTRRSTLMQHLLQTCCTQGCSFDKLKEICFG